MVDSEYTYCKGNQGDWRATRALARLAKPGVDGGEARRPTRRAETSERSDVMQCGESFAGYQSHQLREFILVTATD